MWRAGRRSGPDWGLDLRQEAGISSWAMRLSRLRRLRQVQTGVTLGLVFLGPLMAVATFLALGPLNQKASSDGLRLILLADMIYVLALATLVLRRIVQMVSDRRSQSAGSRLHLRLTGVFAIVALIPTVLVAVFGVLTVNIGLEGWFSDRVRSVVGASLEAAQAYDVEQTTTLTQDVRALANFLVQTRGQDLFMDDGSIRPALAQGQAAIQRGLKEVYLINATGELKTRGEKSYLFDYEKPTPDQIMQAKAGQVVLIPDWPNSELRALIDLPNFHDRLLYVSRKVDGKILSLLDETQQTASLYQQLESDRGKILFNFGLLYLGFAVIMIIAAVWGGLWFAERLARPVGRLAGAAQRVGAGDLDVQVEEEESDDEIAMLGRLFNRMTRQLKGQREALIESHAQTEGRRRLFDSVLSNVTAGVIGLDPAGRVDFVNRAGMRMLDLSTAAEGALERLVPEFSSLFNRLRAEGGAVLQDEVRISRRGRLESLLVRMSERRGEDGGIEGFVVAFDDVTDLVSAQRMAAWGDVARRIAHEIKNPLTPIQLSAERIRRKYRTQVQDPEDLEQYTDIIVRQTNDLRRIVDEFSKFARMPEPDRRETDLTALVKAAVMLQENGQPGVTFHADLPDRPDLIELDATMIGQALTNLIKNAGEAIEEKREKSHEGFVPEIRVSLAASESHSVIRICDNGTGLPPDRSRLFEPYVTTREKGTGLGLPIVKKIIEEHGGTLILTDAPVFAGNDHAGAMAEIRLPRATRARTAAGRSQALGGK
ncbi:HAMP domain-containing protein [bacterium]|nr:HAMP domain-containing protein [bacterium]